MAKKKVKEMSPAERAMVRHAAVFWLVFGSAAVAGLIFGELGYLLGVGFLGGMVLSYTLVKRVTPDEEHAWEAEHGIKS